MSPRISLDSRRPPSWAAAERGGTLDAATELTPLWSRPRDAPTSPGSLLLLMQPVSARISGEDGRANDRPHPRGDHRLGWDLCSDGYGAELDRRFGPGALLRCLRACICGRPHDDRAVLRASCSCLQSSISLPKRVAY